MSEFLINFKINIIFDFLLEIRLKIWYYIQEIKKQGDFTMGGTMGGIGTIILMVVLFVALYFFMIRPQKKQEKETNEMRNNLQVGDEITTIGGIIGKIVSIKEETVTIETSHDRTKIRILKTAVRNVDVKAEDAQD